MRTFYDDLLDVLIRATYRVRPVEEYLHVGCIRRGEGEFVHEAVDDVVDTVEARVTHPHIRELPVRRIPELFSLRKRPHEKITVIAIREIADEGCVG